MRRRLISSILCFLFPNFLLTGSVGIARATRRSSDVPNTRDNRSGLEQTIFFLGEGYDKYQKPLIQNCWRKIKNEKKAHKTGKGNYMQSIHKRKKDSEWEKITLLRFSRFRDSGISDLTEKNKTKQNRKKQTTITLVKTLHPWVRPI